MRKLFLVFALLFMFSLVSCGGGGNVVDEFFSEANDTLTSVGDVIQEGAHEVGDGADAVKEEISDTGSEIKDFGESVKNASDGGVDRINIPFVEQGPQLP